MIGLVRFGPFELDLESADLRKKGKSVRLPEQQFQILHELLSREGGVVSREEIRKRLWPNDTVVEFDRSINAAIMKLRIALGDDAEKPQFIETVARRGYRILIPVMRDSIDAPQSLPPAVRRSSLAGQKVSHYRVLGLLGGGGMGLVYKGEDLKLNRPVALKFLPEETSNDIDTLRRFEREAKTASSLSHPNICTIYQVDEHEGQPFIVMELLEGETLREFIVKQGGPGGPAPHSVPLRKLLEIAVQIAEGLASAHEKRIIHRDIKPANIFMTSRGQIKILDFGLAKIAPTISAAGPAMDEVEPSAPARGSNPDQPQVSLNVSHAGATIGTAGYMSPEQIRGEELDVRTDLFSFGLILFEMATGNRAFAGDTQAAVHDAVLHKDQPALSNVNPALPVALGRIVDKALEKDRRDRYATAGEMLSDLRALLAEVDAPPHRDALPVVHEEAQSKRGSLAWWPAGALAAAALAAAISVTIYWHHLHSRFQITSRDIVVLADFENSTGESVFDDALRQGLIVGLEQSPTIQVLSDHRAASILEEMRHPKGEPLTGKVALELCQRTGGKVMVQGSISRLGATYSLGLTALRCDDGDSFAHEQSIAKNKDEIIDALGRTTARLRGRLGEPSHSIERYNTPLEQATTSSLEALKIYTLALTTADKESDTAAIPLYQRAIELDPDFAMAYGSIAESYGNNGQLELASVNAAKAFSLRDRLTEYEQLSIESWYHLYTTGDLKKAVEVLELAVHNYPETSRSLNDLGAVYSGLGEYEKAAATLREAIKLDPGFAIARGNLAEVLMGLNKVDEAGAVLADARRRNMNTEYILYAEYDRSFLLGDTEGRRRAILQSKDLPGAYSSLMQAESNTQAYLGHFSDARRLTAQAASLSEQMDDKESAAGFWAEAAVREAEAGSFSNAQEDIDNALRLNTDRAVLTQAALVKSIAGESVGPLHLTEQLSRQHPSDTLIQQYWLPTIRAEVELHKGNPLKAIYLLSVAEPIERAVPDEFSNSVLYPAYVRGEAYLALGDGPSAVTEFQKLIDSPGMVLNFPLGALALLGRARGCKLEGDNAKARDSYRQFLQLWKDADPDIPILKAAKSESSALRAAPAQ